MALKAKYQRKGSLDVLFVCTHDPAAVTWCSGSGWHLRPRLLGRHRGDGLGTPDETQRYDERVDQLGRNLAWVFRQVKG